MPLQVALPIAHRTGQAGTVTYDDYYDVVGQCLLNVDHYFNEAETEGLSLIQNSAFLSDPQLPDPDNDPRFNLYAMTYGSLSWQTNSLVLRLRREQVRRHPDLSSGEQFKQVPPRGVQLRNLVYQLSPSDTVNVRNRISKLLEVTDHPMMVHQMVKAPGQSKPQLLGTYLSGSNFGTQKSTVLDLFMNGDIELLVRAGDSIGNFAISRAVSIQFLDVCGAISPTSSPARPFQPQGRPINPSYFLYHLLSAPTQTVNILTSLDPLVDLDTGHAHPLTHLLGRSTDKQSRDAKNAQFDWRSDVSPRPLHVTRQLSGGNRLLRFGGLGIFHESRNASNPFITRATHQWRIYGDKQEDTDRALSGKLILYDKSSKKNEPDIQPAQNQRNRIEICWTRYATIINAVALAFEVPCECLLAFAIKETGFRLTGETEESVIRLEPLKVTTDLPQQNAQIQAYQLAAGVNGRAITIPIPWAGDQHVHTASSLTWTQLAALNQQFPNNVRTSPGIVQTLVRDAHTNLSRIQAIYGPNYIRTIRADVQIPNPADLNQMVTILLTARTPAASVSALLSSWFAISVDSTGNDSPGAPHTLLTKRQRALHGFIAGAAHMKLHYSNGFNSIVTDFDPPTMASGYNDKAGIRRTLSTDTVINRYGMVMRAPYAEGYPIIYNSVIDFFNANPATSPALRLGRTRS